MRIKHPLAPQYGKLTVIREVFQSVECRCSCGTMKVVNRSNLRAGRVRSCGQGTCRDFTVGDKRGPKPGFPTWIRPHKIRAMYIDYTERGIEGAFLARQNGVHSHTFYNLVNKIATYATEDGSAIDNYMEAMNAALVAKGKRPVQEDEQLELPPLPAPLVAVPLDQTPKPPPVFTGSVHGKRQ